jgi:two-component system, OmpR family, response regulator
LWAYVLPKFHQAEFARVCSCLLSIKEQSGKNSLFIGGDWMRVLLVEDDSMIGAAVEGALRDASYAVDWAKNGHSALSALHSQHYDLMLLDLGLPGKDGLEVLRTLRANNNPVPLLIMTARDELDDRICGLDSGADDYVVKPFAMAELLARMRAVLRRKGGNATPVLSNGILSLDPASRQAAVHTSNVQQPLMSIQLSGREFALLQALLLRPGTILSRSELEDRIYGWGEEVESNAVEFLIHSLRHKLGRDSIKNVRGLGWMVSKNV